MQADRQEKLHRYRLVLADDGSTIEFDAEGVSQALRRSKDILADGVSGSLVEDGVLLGKISYSPAGYWNIEKPHHARS